MATVENHIYQLKRGSVGAVEALNPELLRGEPLVVFFEDDGIIKLKVGDGERKANDLPYVSGKDYVESYYGVISFPDRGEPNKLYIDIDNDELYRWDNDDEEYVKVSDTMPVIDLDQQELLRNQVTALIDDKVSPVQEEVDTLVGTTIPSMNTSIESLSEDLSSTNDSLLEVDRRLRDAESTVTAHTSEITTIQDTLEDMSSPIDGAYASIPYVNTAIARPKSYYKFKDLENNKNYALWSRDGVLEFASEESSEYPEGIDDFNILNDTLQCPQGLKVLIFGDSISANEFNENGEEMTNRMTWWNFTKQDIKSDPDLSKNFAVFGSSYYYTSTSLTPYQQLPCQMWKATEYFPPATKSVDPTSGSITYSNYESNPDVVVLAMGGNNIGDNSGSLSSALEMTSDIFRFNGDGDEFYSNGKNYNLEFDAIRFDKSASYTYQGSNATYDSYSSGFSIEHYFVPGSTSTDCLTRGTWQSESVVNDGTFNFNVWGTYIPVNSKNDIFLCEFSGSSKNNENFGVDRTGRYGKSSKSGNLRTSTLNVNDGKDSKFREDGNDSTGLTIVLSGKFPTGIEFLISNFGAECTSNSVTFWERIGSDKPQPACKWTSQSTIDWSESHTLIFTIDPSNFSLWMDGEQKYTTTHQAILDCVEFGNAISTYYTIKSIKVFGEVLDDDKIKFIFNEYRDTSTGIFNPMNVLFTTSTSDKVFSSQEAHDLVFTYSIDANNNYTSNIYVDGEMCTTSTGVNLFSIPGVQGRIIGKDSFTLGTVDRHLRFQLYAKPLDQGLVQSLFNSYSKIPVSPTGFSGSIVDLQFLRGQTTSTNGLFTTSNTPIVFKNPNPIKDLWTAIRWSLHKLRERYPYSTLFVSTPIQMASKMIEDGELNYSRYDNILSAIRTLCSMYSANLIDAYAESGIQAEFEVDRAMGRYLADGAHTYPQSIAMAKAEGFNPNWGTYKLSKLYTRRIREVMSQVYNNGIVNDYGFN